MKSRVRATTILLSVLCIPGTVATLTNCQLQSVCQPSYYWYDDYYVNPLPDTVHEPLPSGAGVVDATHWQSGPIDGAWLDYPGARQIVLFPNVVPGPGYTLPGNFPGPYTNIFVYVSPNEDANGPGSNWTLASGNIAEVTTALLGTQWIVSVTNASCAQYYVRVVVERAEPDASAPDDAGAEAGTAGDAGADAGAPTDASLDAQVDGTTDATSD